jgi:hypothetical protein
VAVRCIGCAVFNRMSQRDDKEPERLGSLQHTNIVPIYSVHHSIQFQVVCMSNPGSHTLATVPKRQGGGILRRDLKPQNVLLSHDGQPMSLNFNVAMDTRSNRNSQSCFGGTVPFGPRSTSPATCVTGFVYFWRMHARRGFPRRKVHHQ